MSLDALDEGPRRLILQDCCIQTVVLTLTTRTAKSGGRICNRICNNVITHENSSHLLEHWFVVVDVIYSHNDLRGAAERVRPTGRVVIGGSDVEDVLRPPQPGRRAPPQLNNT